MFDIGFWELIFIAVIALLVLGPEKLPSAIRSVSSMVNSVRQTANALKSELNHELRVEELHKQLREAEAKGMQNLTEQQNAAVDELQQAAESVTQPYQALNKSASADANQTAATQPQVKSDTPAVEPDDKKAN